MVNFLKFRRWFGMSLALWMLGASLSWAQTQTPDPTDTTYVRFVTSLGNIDVQMLTKEAPLNVANFMGYVTNGTYNNSFIHRSIPGFILQGGNYNFVGGTPTAIGPANPTAVNGEHGANNPTAFSNVRGTLALALSNGPDTGTTSWFFNLVDNNNSTADNNLDQSAGGGPFTVFGVVANSSSLAVMDAIAAEQTYNFGDPLANTPLLPTYTVADYNNNVSPFLTDFIYTTSFTTFTISSFSSWQAAFSSDPDVATDSLPAATPQGDATPNLVKYVCGVSADAFMSASDRAKLPTGGKTVVSNVTYMTLTWHQRPNLSVVGVTPTVQASTDLTTWAASTATATQTGTDSDGDAIMQVQVPAPASGFQFLRLSVTQ